MFRASSGLTSKRTGDFRMRRDGRRKELGAHTVRKASSVPGKDGRSYNRRGAHHERAVVAKIADGALAAGVLDDGVLAAGALEDDVLADGALYDSVLAVGALGVRK